MQPVEHILLESDERNIPQRHTARRVHTSHLFRSRIRRCAVELEIIDYYYLYCRSRNAHSDLSDWVLDLRFVDPSLHRRRHIPSRWLALTSAFAIFAVLIWIATPSTYDGRHIQSLVSALLLFLTACTGAISIYRLTETLELRSVYGQAKLLELTGGLGALRSLQPFVLKLGAHLRIAASARRGPKNMHLRDEMREHHRLKEAGVLSNAQYEESKKRILAHHPAA